MGKVISKKQERIVVKYVNHTCGAKNYNYITWGTNSPV